MTPHSLIACILAILLLNVSFSYETSNLNIGEICDNALDDDGDGLIDMNDPDCLCPELKPVSLIPNPSFEEYQCCPSGIGQLHCANNWIQASEATTDYFNICDYVERSDFPVPLPIPDGEGYVGFRNGRFSSNGGDVNWKEYAGVCLNNPLKAGTSYTFQFDIGFSTPANSPPMNMVFYGSASCDHLPFGIGEIEFGCPLNGPGWMELDRVFVAGENWQRFQVTATPDVDMHAIAIGPDCIEVFSVANTYYYLDNLVSANTESFQEKISSAGHPCSANYTLRFPPEKASQYQWYRNGIAVQGATDPELKVRDKEGVYQILLTNETSCRLSNKFSVEQTPEFETLEHMELCEGEGVQLGDLWLTEPGSFSALLQSSMGCDSFVTLDLEVQSSIPDTFRTSLFQGESLKIAQYRLKAGSERLLHFTSGNGCDSLIYAIAEQYNLYLPNAFSPNGDGRNDLLVFSGDWELLRIDRTQIFDRWGNQLFDKSDEILMGWDGKSKSGDAPIGVYVYILEITLHDGMKKMLTGEFTLLR